MVKAMCQVFFMLMSIMSVSSLSVKSGGPSGSKPPKVTKFVQEAELKHGRVAMVSALTIPTIELLNGNHQGIYELSSKPLSFQLGLLGVFACSEVAQLFKAYEFPMEPKKWFNMKDSHVPGEYSFDPLGFSNKSGRLSEYKRTELFNGRLAMLAAFGILVQEICTDKTVIDTLVGKF